MIFKVDDLGRLFFYFRPAIFPLAVLLVFCLTGCSPGWSGGEGEKTASFEECLGQGKGGDFHAIQCVADEQSRMDSELEDEIRRISGHISRSDRILLTEEQGQWSANLYDHCIANLRNSLNGTADGKRDSFLPSEDADIYEYGTQGMLIFNWCKLDETEDHIRELKKRYGDRRPGSIGDVPHPAEMAWDDSAPYDECIDHSDGLTINLNNCAGREQIRMSDILDREVEAAMVKLLPAQKKRLESEQKDWAGQLSDFCFAKIDAELDEVYGGYPDDGGTTAEERHLQYGTLDVLMYRTCILTETEERVRVLKARNNGL